MILLSFTLTEIWCGIKDMFNFPVRLLKTYDFFVGLFGFVERLFWKTNVQELPEKITLNLFVDFS